MSFVGSARTGPITPENFGAVGNGGVGVGAANDTAAIQAWLNAHRDGGLLYADPGQIYSVDEGVLLLQPSSADQDAVLPTLLGKLNLAPRGTSDAPILRIWNADYPGKGGATFYRGGSIGDIHFVGNPSHAGASRHGLSLRGVQGVRFGVISGSDLQGAPLYFPFAQALGSTDYYEVSGNVFKGVSAFRCDYAVFNSNDNGDAGQIYGSVFHSRCRLGGYLSSGRSSRIMAGSATALQAGYAFKFAAGTATRSFNTCEKIEDDANVNGIWVEAQLNFDVKYYRSVWRKVGLETWPRTALKVGGASGKVGSGSIHLDIVIDSSCEALAATPIDFSNSANIGDLDVFVTVTNNTSLPCSAADLIRNLSANARVKIWLNGAVVINQRVIPAVSAQGSAVTRIATTGAGVSLGHPSVAITNLSLRSGAASLLDANGWAIIAQNGNYDLQMSFMVPIGENIGQAPAGARCRYGFYLYRGGAVTALLEVDENVPASGTNYTLKANGHGANLRAGDKVFPYAIINDAPAPVAVTASLGYAASNHYSVRCVGVGP